MPQNEKFPFYLVSVCGGSASGKSSLLELIRAEFGKQLSIISQDDYYRPIGDQKKDMKGVYNFDLPEAIDHEYFLRDLKILAEGKTVEKEEYVFNHPEKVPGMKTFSPAPIVVIEGLFINYTEELNRLIDLKVFVETDIGRCYERRRKRDLEERGIPEDIFIHQWNHHVLPAYDQYVKPSREQADLVIQNNDNMDAGFSKLKSAFLEYLK